MNKPSTNTAIGGNSIVVIATVVGLVVIGFFWGVFSSIIPIGTVAPDLKTWILYTLFSGVIGVGCCFVLPPICIISWKVLGVVFHESMDVSKRRFLMSLIPLLACLSVPIWSGFCSAGHVSLRTRVQHQWHLDGFGAAFSFAVTIDILCAAYVYLSKEWQEQRNFGLAILLLTIVFDVACAWTGISNCYSR